uniref:Uncharacterized protein n=1 Tax=Rhizophora mucronata TaxID=61149 RepID=A0A2P2QNJ4_RHIMU
MSKYRKIQWYQRLLSTLKFQTNNNQPKKLT